MTPRSDHPIGVEAADPSRAGVDGPAKFTGSSGVEVVAFSFGALGIFLDNGRGPRSAMHLSAEQAEQLRGFLRLIDAKDEPRSILDESSTIAENRPPRDGYKHEYVPASRLADLERQLAEALAWRYVDGPGEGADPRCLVTLEEDRMRWVGIRAWNANTRQWLNGGEPERARVIAWQPLPIPASGYWQHGKLVNTERV